MEHPYSPKNWPEDFPTENGNYTCICCICDQEFIGNKHRVICKECAENGNKAVFDPIFVSVGFPNIPLLSKEQCPCVEHVFNTIQPNPTMPWPDPTLEDLNDDVFNKIWDCVKRWDINVPDVYAGYCGATGNHVKAIMNAIKDGSTWQPVHTVPHDRLVLIKTSTGIVSGQYFPGELSRENPYHNEEYKAPVFSCYDDAIVIDCDYQELVEGEVEEYFPEILGWMEIPK